MDVDEPPPQASKSESIPDANPFDVSKPSNSKVKVLPRRVRYTDALNKESLHYDLTKKKGLGVIFNHLMFKNGYNEPRKGTTSDVTYLQNTLVKLNFDIKTYDDLDTNQIRTVMEAVGNLDESKLSCLIIVVLSHGVGKSVAAYDRYYPVEMLWKNLAGKLVGIPKLYFIQACRGKLVDRGLEVTDSIFSGTEDGFIYKLPLFADFLQMYSTYEGHISWREQSGSWFIQTLCSVFEEKAGEWDLLQMLTYVNKKVATDFQTFTHSTRTNEAKAMPQIVSTLTKFLKFHITPKNVMEKD